MEIIAWLIVLPLGIMAIAAWLYRVPDRGALPAALKVARSRLWGEFHRYREGKLWSPGEREMYRASLLGATSFSVDRHMPIQQRPTCIVTSRRVVLCDSHGRSTQLPIRDIRSVRPRRTHDTHEGFSYSVVMERVGSPVHDPEGDLCLLCGSQEQSHALASAIEDLYV